VPPTKFPEPRVTAVPVTVLVGVVVVVVVVGAGVPDPTGSLAVVGDAEVLDAASWVLVGAAAGDAGLVVVVVVLAVSDCAECSSGLEEALGEVVVVVVGAVRVGARENGE
jgi:hypothetical protein